MDFNLPFNLADIVELGKKRKQEDLDCTIINVLGDEEVWLS